MTIYNTVAQCNELNPMAPLRVTTTSNQEGGIATYTCDPGFQVLVGGTRTCRSDSTWSGIEPTCSMITGKVTMKLLHLVSLLIHLTGQKVCTSLIYQIF